MARTLMAHSTGLATTIFLVPTCHSIYKIHPEWLELPLARTKFHGPKHVQAIEVPLSIQINT